MNAEIKRGNKQVIVAGTRGSDLALAQTQTVIGLILSKNKGRPQISIETKVIRTLGDDLYRKKTSSGRKLTGKDSFTREIDLALLRGDIDFAVHSLKDVPVENTVEIQDNKLDIAAFPKRESPYDVLISKNKEIKKIEDLPENARVGTSSLRRRFQLKLFRPDLKIVEIHGNVPTRIKKMHENGQEENENSLQLDAIVLAEAGLKRLKIEYDSRSVISSEIMLPAVGQGCLAVKVRSKDYRTKRIIKAIDDEETRLCVTAERSFSKQLGAGCNTPIAALATIDRKSRMKHKMALVGLIAGESKLRTQGVRSIFVIRDMIKGKPREAQNLGIKLAQTLKAMSK
jgi:hydroxymethylbilane synthase